MGIAGVSQPNTQAATSASFSSFPACFPATVRQVCRPCSASRRHHGQVSPLRRRERCRRHELLFTGTNNAPDQHFVATALYFEPVNNSRRSVAPNILNDGNNNRNYNSAV